jgi:hypothetical protein
MVLSYTNSEEMYILSSSMLILVGLIHPVVVPSPVLFTIPEAAQISQVSPFSLNIPETPTPVDVLPPTLNPASSIDDLLRHYGVQPAPVRTRIPPPPALAIFPSEYRINNRNRVHIRHRPRPSLSFSHSSARTFSRGHTRFNSSVSVASGPSTRSDASSDVLGLTPLYEETGEIPSPLLRRPRGWYTPLDSRPHTAGSNVPQLRRRERVVEVVSCSTQTNTPPSPASVVPNLQSINSVHPIATTTGMRESEVGEVDLLVRRSSRRRGKRSHGRGTNSTNAVKNEDAGVQGAQRRRRRRCDKTTQSIDQSTETIVSNEQSIRRDAYTPLNHISRVSQNSSGVAPSESGSTQREQCHNFQNSETATDSEPPTSFSMDASSFTRRGGSAATSHQRSHSSAIDPYHLQREAAKSRYRKSRSNLLPAEPNK